MPETGFTYGQMRTPVVFERDTTPHAGPTGSRVKWSTYEVVHECLARVRPARNNGREVVVSDRVVTLKTYEITMHYTATVDEQMRVRLPDGRLLYVRTVPFVEPGQRLIDVLAEEVQ